jgi:transposase
LDLRVRIAAFVEAGRSCRAADRHFGVSDSCAIKLMQRQRYSGSLTRARQGRPPGRGKLVAYETFLIYTVEAEPAITMPELAAQLLEEHGIVAAPAALSRFLCRRGFTYKVHSRIAPEFASSHPTERQQEAGIERHHGKTIEQAFAKINAHLRKAEARTFDALWRTNGISAMGSRLRNAATTSPTQAMDSSEPPLL